MIKHRFILRSYEDAEIFAAIPTEHRVLKWEQWKPQIPGAMWDAKNCEHVPGFIMWTRGLACMNFAAKDSRALREMSLGAEVDWTLDCFDSALEESHKFAVAFSKSTAPDGGERPPWPEQLVATLLAARDRIDELHLPALPPGDARGHFRGMRFVIGEAVDNLFEFRVPGKLSTDLECPVGVPFAYYTVEIPVAAAAYNPDDPTGVLVGASDPKVRSLIFNVIEGKAWNADYRAPSDSEAAKLRKRFTELSPQLEPSGIVRVVEMVSQMLTERNLNPRADTRVILREVDPAHAARVRKADGREKAEPKLRTIKFEISPPRYLRQAAQRILSSPVRAHWVIGHWRNQACGEARQFRRQTWIAPHIRGLGEAGPIVSRVAAPTPQDPPAFPTLQ